MYSLADFPKGIRDRLSHPVSDRYLKVPGISIVLSPIAFSFFTLNAGCKPDELTDTEAFQNFCASELF